jgi:hypothetical protein
MEAVTPREFTPPPSYPEAEVERLAEEAYIMGGQELGGPRDNLGTPPPAYTAMPMPRPPPPTYSRADSRAHARYSPPPVIHRLQPTIPDELPGDATEGPDQPPQEGEVSDGPSPEEDPPPVPETLLPPEEETQAETQQATQSE